MPPGIIEDLIKPEASPVLDQEGNLVELLRNFFFIQLRSSQNF